MREQFGSKAGFVMAMAGSAIGLGNIWRFPYIVGEYGGAAFIVIYVLAAVFISLPIFLCEATIGRRGRATAFVSFERLAPGTKWKHMGTITTLAAFVIMSYYSVVGGWSLDFLARSCITGLGGSSPDGGASGIFQSFSASTWEPLAAHTLFLLVSLLIIMLGVQKGIEKFSKMIIPVLFIIVVGLAVFSCLLPGAGEGVKYLLKPDFSRLSGKSVVYALGQSFYSMSLGVGGVLVYSSYMRKEENLLEVGAWTAGFDTIFAILSGLMIMPAVFAAGLKPGSGPGLVFETFPYIFEQMGAYAPVTSRIVTILFFLAILMAAITSEISLFEVCVAHVTDRFKVSRKKATIGFFAASWVLGALCSLSFGPLSHVKVFGLGIFGMCDTLASNYFMIIGALAFSIFVGWKMDRKAVREEMGGCYKIVFPLVRYVIPIVILGIFVTNFIV